MKRMHSATGRLTLLSLLIVGATFLIGLGYVDFFSPTVATCTPSGGPTVVTDQADYQAGEMVHIQGCGFTSYETQTLTLRISVPDSSTVTANVTIASGGFTYDYMLGMTGPGGLYTVDVLQNSTVLATTTFTDVGSPLAYADAARTIRRAEFERNAGPPFTPTPGDTVYVTGTGLFTGRSYRFEMTNATSNVIYQQSACFTGVTSKDDQYVFQPTDPLGLWLYNIREFTASTNCTGSSNVGTASMALIRAYAFTSVADRTTCTTEFNCVTNAKTYFAPGSIVYIRVIGIGGGFTDIDDTWIKPNLTNACTNTAGADRPDTASAIFPAASKLDTAYRFEDAGETPDAACPALSSPADNGLWQLKLVKTSGDATLTSRQTVQLDAFLLQPPTLTVNKVCVPPADTGLFNLRIDGATAGTGANAPCGSGTGAVVESVGSHTVSETAGTGTNLAAYSTVIGGDCAANGSITLAAGDIKTCTITNTLNSATFTVYKDFSDKPSTDTTTVSVTLSCGAGTITPPNPKSASEASPAVFTVTGLATSTTCTASESPVPGGYTASGCTAPVTLPATGSASCTITNTTTASFTVYKDFSDKPSTDTTTVSVTLSCGAGTITPPNPKSASEASPAVFTVTGLSSSTTCTASESPVPGGYTASGCTAPVTLPATGSASCTITNALNSAIFTVYEDFSDKPSTDTTTVSVTLTCGAGTITPPNPKSASEASPAVFIVTGLSSSTTCTASESPVPSGYTASGCTAPVTLPATGSASCTITNNAQATVTISKVYSNGSATPVSVTLSCTSGTITPSATQSVPGGGSTSWTVTGFASGATCSASEAVPSGYLLTGNTCTSGNLGLSAGAIKTCTITNTLYGVTFQVNKAYSDSNTTAVTVSLSCTSGSVSPASASAAPGLPATFTVTGYSGNPACTGTESPVPAGYSSSGTCSAPLLTGSCTIVNTFITPTPPPTPTSSGGPPVGGIVDLSIGGGPASSSARDSGNGGLVALLLASLGLVAAGGSAFVAIRRR